MNNKPNKIEVMKKRVFFSGTIALLLILFTAVSVFAVNHAKNKKEGQQVTVIRGKVVDSDTKQPLIFAGVAVKESNISTVTNVDGEFLLKVPAGENLTIEFSFVGYKNKSLPVSEMKTNGNRNIIELDPAMIPIKEVVVKPMLPEEIIEEAIYRFSQNYASVPNEMTGFYRETIKKNRSYVSIGEAVVEVFKAPYQNDLRYDAVRIYKGRKNNDVEKMDTVLFKLQGGPNTTLDLDIVKNTEAILSSEVFNQYDFRLSNIVIIDDRTNYVIEFVQKPSVSVPLFMGRLYIDIDTYAIAQAEFSVNLSNREAATSMFIRKKPLGMQISPEITSYLIRYRESNGKWYFSYSRAEVKFKVDWKKKLFNTNYTTMSELAMTDRTEEDVLKFSAKERIRPSDFFTEEVAAFADPDFWGDYNVIEPDQSIESAIRRLSRKVKFNDRY